MRPIKPEMKFIKKLKKKIFQMKMNMANSNKTPEWNLKELDMALAKLKTNNSRDFEGLSN